MGELLYIICKMHQKNQSLGDCPAKSKGVRQRDSKRGHEEELKERAEKLKGGRADARKRGQSG